MINLNKNTTIGDRVAFQEHAYKVINIYKVTDDYMKDHHLLHRTRVTLEKVEDGEPQRLDFAITK